MNDLFNKINNPCITSEERLDALKTWQNLNKSDRFKIGKGEINNHIHTIFSFSPYTPAMAALRAKEAGLEAAGSVDHDSIAAADEMIQACALLGIGGCCGFEVRVSFKKGADGNPGRFADRKINNPDSEGFVYMTVQGIPKNAVCAAAEFLKPVREQRLKRTKAMTVSANILLKEAGISEIDFEKDICGCSKYDEGGGVTDRHLLAAAAKKITGKFGRGLQLTQCLKSKIGITVPVKIRPLLLQDDNPHYLYDLLGVLKTEFLPEIFIQPDENECIPAEKVTSFAASINAIPAYAYLGDIAESLTGDKRAEKFEDDYIDDLFDELSRLDYKAVTYMPPRNTPAQLEKVQQLCRKYKFMEISGVDINTSRQSFNCPEVLKDQYRHLVDTTWALIAHERLSGIDSRFGLFSQDNPFASFELEKRLNIYSGLGKKFDLRHPDESAAESAVELIKGNYP